VQAAIARTIRPRALVDKPASPARHSAQDADARATRLIASMRAVFDDSEVAGWNVLGHASLGR
jgi:hypothetical protein